MRRSSFVVALLCLGACASSGVVATSSQAAFQQCSLHTEEWAILAQPPIEREQLLSLSWNGTSGTQYLHREGERQLEAWFEPASSDVRLREGDLLVCRYTAPKHSCIIPITSFKKTNEAWEVVFQQEAVCTSD
jgi:hypothetical protein